MIILSSGLVLAPQAAANDPRNGVILWQSVVNADTLEAGSEADDYPASNLYNPATNLKWQSAATGADVLTITIPESNTGPIDGIGIAGSNFSSAGISVTVEARDNEDDDESWVEFAYPLMRADNGPVLFRGERQSWRQIRITLSEGTEPAEMSVLYVGELLVLPRGVIADHTSIVDGLVVDEAVGRSRAGAFLGSITIGEHVETSVSLGYFDPAWYRAYVRPFVQSRRPFFYAWHPLVHPSEVGFVWFPAGHNPRPVERLNSRTVMLDFDIQGIVR